MEPLTFLMARKTVKFYACSNCWGELEMTPDEAHPEHYQVTCKKCKDQTKGYVTQHYVERRRAESQFEEVNATHMLVKAGVLENPLTGKSKADLLKDLGF